MSAFARAGEGVDSWQGGAFRAALGSAALFAMALVAPAAGVPLLGGIAALAPYPLALARVASGPGTAWLAALVAVGLVGGLGSVGAGVVYLAVFAVPGLLMAEGLARGRGLLHGAAWAFAWLATVVAVSVAAAGSALRAWLTEPLARVASREFLETMREQGVALEQLSAVSESVTALRETLLVVYPAALIILGGLLVVINGWALRRFLVRHDPAWIENGELAGLRWPFGLVIAFVAAAAALTLPALRTWALNALLLLGFLFVLQGIAVAAFVSRRLLPPVAVWVVMLALAMTHAVAPLALLALLGLFDQWLDVRHWAEPPAEGQ